MEQALQQLQRDLTQQAIFWGAIELIVFIAAMGVLYLVVKAAVRDGINESNLGQRTNPWQRALRQSTTPHDDLRAD